MRGEQGCLREILDGVAQGLREVFDKRAASGGTGLVQLDVVDAVIADLDAFHVLSADIQHAVDVRIEKGGGIVMGDGLHLSLIEHQGGFDQRLAVSRGTGADDDRVFRHMGIGILDRTDRGGERIALVIVIERI